MTKRKSKSPPKRKRRKYSDEFKREAVKLVFAQQLSLAEAARNLGIHPNLLRSWMQRGQAWGGQAWGGQAWGGQAWGHSTLWPRLGPREGELVV